MGDNSLKKSRHNIVYTFFYSNISEFSRKFEGILDEGVYKTSIQNMHKIGQKENYFKSADVSMLVNGSGVSQFTQFYEKIKNKYKLLPCPYMGSYLGEKSHNFLQEKWIIALAKSVLKKLAESLRDMPTIKYRNNLIKIWILQNIRFLNNVGLIIHFLRHGEIL